MTFKVNATPRFDKKNPYKSLFRNRSPIITKETITIIELALKGL